MIKFGTDGWRGIISDDFTFHNVRLVAHGIADYIKERGEQDKGIVVGYDARLLSRQYAENCAAVLAANGVRVWIAAEILPTPALTWQVKDRQAAGGVMITASHNPAEYNGLKFKAPYGGSASPEIVAAIEKHVHRREASGESYPPIPMPQAVEWFAPQEAYLTHVKAMLDTAVLKSFHKEIMFDCMHGAAGGYAAALAGELGINLLEVRGDYNPGFGGVSPEPIQKNLDALRQAVVAHRAYSGVAVDGDGDRIGAVDENGRFINAHQIMALLIRYLVEKRGWTGGVAQSLHASGLVAKVAAKYGLPLYQTPVGFKYIAELMLSKDILIGGEEGGGVGLKNYIPERDGMLLGFLLIEMMAAYRRPLGYLLDELSAEHGRYYYGRRDLHLPEEKKQALLARLAANPPSAIGSAKVRAAACGDGCTLELANGWLIFRASGTEPLVRIYAEVDSQEALDNLLEGAMRYAEEV
ncbi:MAG: phosphoglucomutase/phosphomannomutase family protein [Negativicutes bacterium]|nr:phosphoglucomutase/phosphomannomutase family protein [Negativicutes bacterium]